MPKLYSEEVTIVATVYVLANSEQEARAKLVGLTDGTTAIEFSDRRQQVADDIYVTGETYAPDMPDISFSPVMTLKETTRLPCPWLVEDFDTTNEEEHAE